MKLSNKQLKYISFYKNNFFKKMSLKNPETLKNVKKISGLKYLNCNS